MNPKAIHYLSAIIELDTFFFWGFLTKMNGKAQHLKNDHPHFHTKQRDRLMQGRSFYKPFASAHICITVDVN